MFNMLKAAVIKETRIIFRDIEALAILFVLPAAFVLIMSLALQDAFREQAGIKFSMLIVNKDKGEVGKSLVDAFVESHYFDVIIPESLPDPETIDRETNEGKYQFALVIPEKATSHAVENSKYLLTGLKKYKKDAVEIKLYVDPAIRGDHRSVVLATLNRSIKEIENTIIVEAIGRRSGSKSKKDDKPTLFSEVKDPFENRISDKPSPTSVQQNAPGWGLLAMFFLVIPLAGTLVRERSEGNLLRLQTMAAPISILLAGKIVPYFVVNQIQIGLILLEGVYLLPLLGGEKLEMGPHPEAIIPLSFAISFAAIGYGLMVAAFCRTAEQATSRSEERRVGKECRSRWSPYH